MPGLIIGYGRAGQRHGKILDELGIEWRFVDPEVIGAFHSYSALDDALENSVGFVDFAVIATPPDLHLSQIRQCLDAGLPVLCEKPLCGLGQLAEAEALLKHPNASRVMVAYNWRWHPEIKRLKAVAPSIESLSMFCNQYRELPEWGLLLDHCSHDLDIIRFLWGKVEIETASFSQNMNGQSWSIGFEAGNILEVVASSECKRIARLTYCLESPTLPDVGYFDLDPDPAMFTDMWVAFLRGEYVPGVADAIETQRLLERCRELAID